MEWLQQEAELADLQELDQIIQDYEASLNWFWKGNVPEQAGERLARYKAFRASIRGDDVLWRFRSPEETWDQGLGLAGFAIVLEGEMMDAIVTLLN
jgi:hypothetical protein